VGRGAKPEGVDFGVTPRRVRYIQSGHRSAHFASRGRVVLPDESVTRPFLVCTCRRGDGEVNHTLPCRRVLARRRPTMRAHPFLVDPRRLLAGTVGRRVGDGFGGRRENAACSVVCHDHSLSVEYGTIRLENRRCTTGLGRYAVAGQIAPLGSREGAGEQTAAVGNCRFSSNRPKLSPNRFGGRRMTRDVMRGVGRRRSLPSPKG